MDQHSWYLVTVDFHHYRIAVDEIDETESYLSTYHFTDYCRVERRDDGAAGQAGAPGGDAGHHEDHAGVHQVSARARVLQATCLINSCLHNAVPPGRCWQTPTSRRPPPPTRWRRTSRGTPRWVTAVTRVPGTRATCLQTLNSHVEALKLCREVTARQHQELTARFGQGPPGELQHVSCHVSV